MGLKRSKNFKSALKTADQWFSRYIRLRDADCTGIAHCVTCNTRKHFKEMDAGHFISRRYMSTRFDEKNVHAQCQKCNKYNSGEQFLYSRHVDVLYGKGTKDQLYKKSQEIKKYTKNDLMEIARMYKFNYTEMLKSKNIDLDA